MSVVPRTIEICDIDDEVYAALERRAAALGLSVPEMLRHETIRLAARATVEDWLDRTRRDPAARIKRNSVASLDELRGP